MSREKIKKILVALPEAMPSPFGTATLRLAPSALAALGLRSAAKRAPRHATNIIYSNKKAHAEAQALFN